MRKLHPNRANSAQAGGLWVRNPNAVIMGVLLVLLLLFSMWRAMNILFFQLRVVSDTVYNVLIVTTAVFTGITLKDWLGDNKRNLAIFVAIALVVIFALFGDVIGEFLFGATFGE